jgi:hypothetical protein
MALDLTKLRAALPFRAKPRSANANKVLDVRVTVQENARTSSGLLWDIGDTGLGPQGGQTYVRPSENPAGILGMLAIRLDEMEREVRADMAKAAKVKVKATRPKKS